MGRIDPYTVTIPVFQFLLAECEKLEIAPGIPAQLSPNFTLPHIEQHFCQQMRIRYPCIRNLSTNKKRASTYVDALKSNTHFAP